MAARDLDGAVDVTLTTGSTRAPDRGALYVAQCAAAVKEASGLPVEAQFEPPEDLDVIDRVADLGVDTVGIHVESFDPAVLARVAPAKARTGIDGYFRAWERAVPRFGEGQVTTYVILGMGEDPELTVEGCRRAVDIGVYPFVVPLRPVAGSLMADWSPPPHDYVERIVRRVTPYLDGARPRRRDRQGGLLALPRLLADGRRAGPPPDRAQARRPPVADVLHRTGVVCRVADDPWTVAEHHRIRDEVFVRRAAPLPRAPTVTGATTTPPTIKVLGFRDDVAGGAVRLYPLDDSGLWQGDRLAVAPRGSGPRPRCARSCGSRSPPRRARAAGS